MSPEEFNNLPAERVDRLPPFSLDAEQGVLGCIFLSPWECLEECVEKFNGASVFYDLRHQLIYNTMVAMMEALEPIDLITMSERLKKEGQLEAVGGLPYLAALPDKVPSAANLSFYVSIVREKFYLRRIIKESTDNVGLAYEWQGTIDEFIDDVESRMLAVAEGRSTKQLRTARELVQACQERIETYYQAQGGLIGLGTGFQRYDSMTGGLINGEMVVIAARPGTGKTAIAMNIAEAVAMGQNIPVGVFSLEMGDEALMLRVICSRARVNLRDVREGIINQLDVSRMTRAGIELSQAPIYIDDAAGMTILQLRAKARRMWRTYGVRLFIVDYLQLLHGTKRNRNREQEIAEISAGVKALAKELNVPFIVLAQLNRGSILEGRKPRISDLRESGAIEQDADLIGLLYDARDEEEQERNPNPEILPVNLIIGKQRNGPVGEVPLVFRKTITRFESRIDIEEPSAPTVQQGELAPPPPEESTQQPEPPAQGEFIQDPEA